MNKNYNFFTPERVAYIWSLVYIKFNSMDEDCRELWIESFNGAIHTGLEKLFLKICQREWPEYKFEHPADSEGTSDIYSPILDEYLEIKCCGQYDAQWTNGPLLYDFKTFNCTFVHFGINYNDSTIFYREIYLGETRYKDWPGRKGDGTYTISKRSRNYPGAGVADICENITYLLAA